MYVTIIIVVKRCVAERTNTEEVGPAEQSEKAEGCREDLWNVIIIMK